MSTRPSDLRSRLATAAAALGLLLGGAIPGLAAQQPGPIVAKEVRVSAVEAALRLSFLDGTRLELALRDGAVLLDGGRVGAYAAGDPLEQTLRALLAQAVALENGPLARALIDWSPPAELAGEPLAVARVIDERLEAALQGALGEIEAPTAVLTPDDAESLSSLLTRPELLAPLGRLLEGVARPGLQLRVGGGTVDIPAGDTVRGPLVVVNADVELAGRVEGDLLVAGGEVRLRDGGEITGNLRLAEGTLFSDGGMIEGDVLRLDTDAQNGSGGVDRDRLREELRDEIRREIRANARGLVRTPSRGWAQSMASLFDNVWGILFLSGFGWLLLHFAPVRMGRIVDTVRRRPGRAAAVGFAGAFLTVPVWVLGTLALVLTILGILLAPFWAALFPLAVALAWGAGTLAVAIPLGGWLSERSLPGTRRIRAGGDFARLVGGVFVLLTPIIVADLLAFGGGALDGYRGFLSFVGFLGFLAAGLVGFGAVLLTRGGKRGPDPIGWRGSGAPRPGSDPEAPAQWWPASSAGAVAAPLLAPSSSPEPAASDAEDPDPDAPPPPPEAGR